MPIFMKYDGVEGGVAHSGHAIWIDLQSGGGGVRDGGDDITDFDPADASASAGTATIVDANLKLTLMDDIDNPFRADREITLQDDVPDGAETASGTPLKLFICPSEAGDAGDGNDCFADAGDVGPVSHDGDAVQNGGTFPDIL